MSQFTRSFSKPSFKICSIDITRASTSFSTRFVTYVNEYLGITGGNCNRSSKALNADLLSVSIDSEHAHKAWIEAGLGPVNYPMASDITKQVSKDYGVLIEEEGIALRGLFIIDPEGVVRYSVVHDLNVGRNVDETLRVLEALNNGGLCPVNWEKGDDLL